MAKLKKVQVIFLIIIESFILFYSSLSNYNPLMLVNQFFYYDLDKLKVHFQATTGPRNYLDEDKDQLKKLERKKYPNASNNEIKLVGNTSFSFEEDYLNGDKITLVYGKIIGVTHEYEDCGSGIVPVFKVYYYQPVNYAFNGPFYYIVFFYQLFILYIVVSKFILFTKYIKVNHKESHI